MAIYNLEPWQEQRVLRFLNAASAEEIQRTVTDDPRFGVGPPRAYGVRRALAARIVAARHALPGGRFSRLSEVDAIFGLGTDTLHDLLAALLPVEIPGEVVRRLQAATRVVAVTGAGVSQPSGLAPIDPTDLAAMWTPKGFAKDVQIAWEFHLSRRNDALGARPNAAHVSLDALANWVLEKRPTGVFTLVTQNQDRLHQRAAGSWAGSGAPARGAYPIIELHGHLFQGRCLSCDARFDLPASLNRNDDESNEHKLPATQLGPRYLICTECSGMARPTVQWLTEPYARGALDSAGAAVLDADVVLFLGTSGRAPVVRWLLHEAHWHARAYTVVVDSAPAAWTTRDGTPNWPGSPVVDATIEGDILDATANLQDAVGW